METLTKEFELPSRGLFGGPLVVTVRPMTTKEEKMIYTARDSSFLNKIVKSCIVEPKDCDLDKLHSADITYLLYMIREMTFGPNYKQAMQCPYCNQKQDIEIDITEMITYLLDFDELEANSEITLPVSKDTLKIKLLSNGDIDDINRTIKRLTKSEKLQDPDGYEYTYRFARLIESINGEEKDIKEIINYLDNLNLRDFDEIKRALSNIRIGLDTTNTRVCKKCGEEVEVQGVAVPEFFRSF
jgi:hypothetical protein